MEQTGCVRVSFDRLGELSLPDPSDGKRPEKKV
jgi:hypothetical protein